MKGGQLAMAIPPIVSPQEWESARLQLLAEEVLLLLTGWAAA
jgi:hypothetical protein